MLQSDDPEGLVISYLLWEFSCEESFSQSSSLEIRSSSLTLSISPTIGSFRSIPFPVTKPTKANHSSISLLSSVPLNSAFGSSQSPEGRGKYPKTNASVTPNAQISLLSVLTLARYSGAAYGGVPDSVKFESKRAAPKSMRTARLSGGDQTMLEGLTSSWMIRREWMKDRAAAV